VVAAEHLAPPRLPSSETLEAWDALEPVERTLLIPLLARVWGQRWLWNVGPADASAQQVIAQLSPDVLRWLPDPVTLGCILGRTRQLVSEAQAHFESYPRGWGVNLGAGLSDYFQWLDNGANHWLDIDRERVMQLRSQCLPRRLRARGLSLDMDEDNWWAKVASCLPPRRQPLFVMLEGVLLYLRPAQVNQVLATLGEHATAGTRVVFDVIPRWLVGWRVRMPLPTQEAPVFQWGLDSRQELEAVHPRLHVQSMTPSPAASVVCPWLMGNPWPSLSPYALVRMTVS